jgi:putative DNA primase/helicase
LIIGDTFDLLDIAASAKPGNLTTFEDFSMSTLTLLSASRTPRVHSAPHPHDISVALSGRIRDLIAALVVGRPVIQSRGRIRVGNRGSLSVDAVTGLWFDHESGVGGDALDLVRHLLHCSFPEAMRWSEQWLGEDVRPAPSYVQPRQRRAPEHDQTGLWQVIWNESTAASGTAAELYLRSRGLTLPDDAPIRFHPACPHGAARLPAMVSLMTDAVSNEPCGVHRTYLRPDGSGKADISPAKMMLGAAGVIRLVPDEDVTMGLGISEGLETALTVMQYAEWRPVWAVTSAGGIAKFPVLNGLDALTIFADNDKPGANGRRPGVDAAHECAKRWLDAGREVTIRLPPEGMDWDDYLRGGRS